MGDGLRAAALAALLLAAPARAIVVDNAVLGNEDDGANWPAWGRTFSEQRYSPLDQIQRGTVARLGLAWTHEFDDLWNMSTAPVAVDGVVYVAAGFSVVHAFDAASGALLWKHDPLVRGKKMRMAWGSRGLTFWNDKVYAGTQDGRLFALDAKSGKLVWEVLTTEPGDNRYITGAPRAFNGKVVVGHGGADFGGVRGYVTAYDAESGKQLWRWHVVPGDPAKGFENAAMAKAAKTWTGEWWKTGAGGTVWNAMTYDPEFNHLYLGTGNGSPWNHKLRSPGGGDNLYLCSVVALDADTGEYRWHYQTTPGESWDYNSAMDMVVATLPIGGATRKVLLHAPKNGFFYVLERGTGKLLSAEKIGKVTWAERVDLATGRPVEVRGARYESGETLIWPGPGGVHNWQPMAYSPLTRLTYIPTREMPGYYSDMGLTPQTWRVEKHGPMGLRPFFDDVPKNAGRSSLLAWDAAQQKPAWRTETPGLTNGGVLVTRGGLVFQGQADGKFVARDADTGALLWSHDLGVGTQAPPITFSAGGKQYVTIAAGWGGGQMFLGSLSAQHGWVGRGYPRRLLTFVLDGKAKLPPSPPPGQAVIVDDPAFKVDAALAGQGKLVYAKDCIICHGTAAVAGGFAPDLRASPVPLSAPAFASIVKAGALEARGMPAFPEFGERELEALRHYIRERARYQPTFMDQMRTLWGFVMLMVKTEAAKHGW